MHQCLTSILDSTPNLGKQKSVLHPGGDKASQPCLPPMNTTMFGACKIAQTNTTIIIGLMSCVMMFLLQIHLDVCSWLMNLRLICVVPTYFQFNRSSKLTM